MISKFCPVARSFSVMTNTEPAGIEVGRFAELDNVSDVAEATRVFEERLTEQALAAVLGGSVVSTAQVSNYGRALRAFEQRHSIAACGPSFHASMPVFSLDRIIVTEDITIGETGVHRTALSREASDHLPIWAHVTLPA